MEGNQYLPSIFIPTTIGYAQLEDKNLMDQVVCIYGSSTTARMALTRKKFP